MKPWILRPSDDVDIRFTLLDLARPGMTLAAWREAGHAALPQASEAKRARVIREAIPLLDLDGEVLAPSSFLTLFHSQAASARDKAQLFLARRYAMHPWVSAIMQELLLPILLESERPLTMRSDAVSEAEFDAFLTAHLDPCSAAARAGTRCTILRALRSMGVLESNRSRRSFVRTVTRTKPSPIAIAWMIAEQMREEHRREVQVSEVAAFSTATLVYALERDYVDISIAEGERAGLFVLSYLAGRPRIMLPDGALEHKEPHGR